MMMMMMTIKSYYMAVLLLTTCAILAHCTRDPAMTADQFTDNPDADKNNDNGNAAEPLTLHKRPAFFVGSRYGRSDGGISQRSATTKTRRLIVVPRNERFFLGARYGKRNGEYMSPYEQDAYEAAFDAPATAAAAANNQAAINNNNNKSIGDDDSVFLGNNHNNNLSHMKMPAQFMSCIYSGIKDYYRCNSVPEINNFINQLSTGHFNAGSALDESN